MTVLALAPAATRALAGPLKGKVTGHEKLIPQVYAELAKPDGHHYTWREPSPTVRSDFRVLSANPTRDICIAAIATGEVPPHEPILIKMTGGHTVPTTIVVAPGTRLSFDNRDPFTHRLYAVGLPTWKAEDIRTGSHREWTAPPGTSHFEFRDELSPSVRLFVVVEPQVIDVAYPGHDGAFAMTLPAGEFVLKTYFEGKQVGKAISVLSKDKQLVEIKEPLNVGEGADAK